jgi:hypothetical protein
VPVFRIEGWIQSNVKLRLIDDLDRVMDELRAAGGGRPYASIDNLEDVERLKVWFVIVDAPDFETGQARGHEILQRIAKGHGWGVSEVRPWDDAFLA